MTSGYAKTLCAFNQVSLFSLLTKLSASLATDVGRLRKTLLLFTYSNITKVDKTTSASCIQVCRLSSEPTAKQMPMSSFPVQ